MTLSERYESIQGVPTPRTVPALDAAEVFLRDGTWHHQTKLVNLMVLHSDLKLLTARNVLNTLTRAGVLEESHDMKKAYHRGQYRTIRTNIKYRLTSP